MCARFKMLLRDPYREPSNQKNWKNQTFIFGFFRASKRRIILEWPPTYLPTYLTFKLYPTRVNVTLSIRIGVWIFIPRILSSKSSCSWEILNQYLFTCHYGSLELCGTIAKRSAKIILRRVFVHCATDKHGQHQVEVLQNFFISKRVSQRGGRSKIWD